MDSTKDANTNITNNGNTLPGPDHEGVAKIVASTKGYMPLDNFDPQKPYETLAKHLEAWQNRLDGNQLQPEDFINELKAAKRGLREKLDAAHMEHIRILKSTYDDRTGDLTTNHGEIRGLIEAWSKEWEGRAKAIETKLEEALIDYCTKRVDDLKDYHDKIEQELRDQIADLRNREQELKSKADDLERERHRWLDERREWLDKRETKFDDEKKEERDAFTGFRRQIIGNEHGDNVDATASEIYARKFSFGKLLWPILWAVVSIAAAAAVGFICKWGRGG